MARFYSMRFAPLLAFLLCAAGCAPTLDGAGGVSVAAAATPLSAAAAAEDAPWFSPPGDWESVTVGGRGGQILRVTTLANDGPGSLRAAVETPGARIIVFEVSGVIDLEKETLVVTEPNLTIAGQTAPSPGITLIRGGMDIRADDVIVQHLRIRPGDNGEPRGSGFAEDGIATVSASGVIVDHCTLTWAVDENLSASGPRFTGATEAEWRAGTSNRILFSNNLIAEGLADSTHPKFEHSKGSLIHDNVSQITITRNLYAHNMERSPLFKGGVQGAIVNNFIYNPGQRAVHYNLQGLEWGAVPYLPGRMTLVGNVMRGGASTAPGLPLLMLGGNGDLHLFARDNTAVDRWGEPTPMSGRYTTTSARIIQIPQPDDMVADLPILAAAEVEAFILTNVGARPWDRDPHDVRVLADVAEGRGAIIDSQSEVGGYPSQQGAQRPFDPAAWNVEDMTPARPDALDASSRSRGT